MSKQVKSVQPEEMKKKVEGNEVEKQDIAKQLEEEKMRSEQFKNSYLRALADYKNLEHRTNSERQSMRDFVKKQVVEQFLPVLDNINQAEVFTKDAGLKMVSGSFVQVLKDLGVEEVNLLGSEYDPHSAEVVEVVAGKQDNIVVEVLQKAYSMNGVVIRPGKVKVGKATI